MQSQCRVDSTGAGRHTQDGKCPASVYMVSTQVRVKTVSLDEVDQAGSVLR